MGLTLAHISGRLQYLRTVPLILYPQALVLKRLMVYVLLTRGLGACVCVVGGQCVCMRVIELPADMLKSGEPV